VILLDVQLTGLTGYETAALIRKRRGTRAVPIIFVTGCSTDSTDIARGYSFGAVDYIFKPVAPAVLRSKVDCFVELAKSTQILKRQTRALELGEKELINSRAAAMLVKEAPVPAILADPRGCVLHANIAAIRVLGAHIGQCPGGANWMTLTPGERWLLTAAVRETAERGVTRELCVHPRLQSGELMAVAVRLGPLRDDDGRVMGVLGIGRDMQPYQQAMLDLERTQVELAGKSQELGHLREIVVERDLAIFRLRKENESLRRGLRGSLHVQAEPDACEGERP
jgi:PAS domain S-box-containing protein